MSSGVTGDFSALKRMQDRIGKLVSVPERIAPVVAQEFKERVLGYFAAQTDPYGAGWKPLKVAEARAGRAYPRTDAGHAPLVKSGTMRDSVDILPFGARVRFWMGVVYARFHISTGRRYAPKPGQLPDPWKDDITRESSKAFTAIAEGR